MVNANWPLVVDQIAFTGDPNDPNSTPSYTDLTARVRSFEASRGRQYEIDQNQTGEAHLTVSDSDEVLNPANTSAPAPYAGNIKPYRRYLRQAMWPPTPVGGAVNLLNATAGYDPDFETTAIGATPPNLLTFNTSPTVQAANPFTGTKSLQWSVAGNSSEQVTGFTVPTIPGRQYTASVYYRQTAANTGVLFVNGGPGSTTTTATGTYVRLAVTFTATQPTHQLFVGSFSPTLASTVNIDAIQLEPGPSPLNANPYFEPPLLSSSWTPVNGATAVATSAQSHEGSYSLLVTPDGVTAVPQAQSEEIPVTANAPYILSGWVRSASSGTRTLNIFWFDSTHTFISSSAISQTLSPGVWTQYGPTGSYAPATAAYARIVTNDPGTPVAANSWRIDQVTFTTPSAFATSGPTIYTPFAGYVERWPSSWNHQGTYGMCALACVDAMAVLAGTDLHTEFRGALLAKKPDYYWALSDGQNATSFAETSGNNGPSLTLVASPQGVGSVTATVGSQTNIPGDPSGTGVAIAGGTSGSGQGYTLKPTPGNTVSAGGPSTVGNSWGITLLLWFTTTDLNGDTIIGLFGSDASVYPSPVPQLLIQGGIGPDAVTAHKGVSFNGTPDSHNFNDGKPHLYAATWVMSSGSLSSTTYVDGQVVSTGGPYNCATDFDVPYPDFTTSTIQVCGEIDAYTIAPGMNGTYAHGALWRRALSSSDITDLWNAGQGYPGETSGQRIARLLSVGGYTGPTAIDNGQSTMGVSTVTEGAALLDACQQVTLSENGNFYVEAGTVTAKSRTDRYLKTTAKWVFGENQAGGEYPYEADIAYDYDPARVVNDVTVTRVNGIKANATDATSQKQYFRRSYPRTIGIQSDLETIDAANYLLGQGKQPVQRISRLSIKPSANPALWPVALGARIGDRVTVKRRTSAGLTMSSDYFIEKIDHTSEPGSWVTTFQMSPVGRYQVGIFDDATYGRFDQTLIFGY